MKDKEDLKKNIKSMPAQLKNIMKRLTQTELSMRISTSDLIQTPFFVQNSIVKFFLFLETIAIKTPQEKEEFFSQLEQNDETNPMALLSKKVLNTKVLSMLTQSLELGTASGKAVAVVLKILASNNTNAETLSKTDEENVSKTILPLLLKWYQSPDKLLRLQLLENLPHYLPLLPKNVFTKEILPHLLNGFIHLIPHIREASVKAVPHFVKSVDSDTLSGPILKGLAKLQMDEQPLIRTNTTICIAQIAPFLSASTRKSILAPACLRPLKDTYARSRQAALTAMQVLVQYFGKDDISQRIIPSIAPLLTDPDTEVRDAAYTTLERFVFAFKPLLHQTSETQLENQTPPSMLGWAFTSLSKKLGGEQTTSTTPTVSPTPVLKSSVSQEKPPSLVPKVEDRDDDDDDFETSAKFEDKKPMKLSSIPSTSISTSSNVNANSGWGDEEDWADSVPQTKKNEPISTPKTVDKGWDNNWDEEDGGWSSEKVVVPEPATTKVASTSSSAPKEDDGWNDDFDFEIPVAKTSSRLEKKPNKARVD
jgi:hypothetical protein